MTMSYSLSDSSRLRFRVLALALLVSVAHAAAEPKTCDTPSEIQNLGDADPAAEDATASMVPDAPKRRPTVTCKENPFGGYKELSKLHQIIVGQAFTKAMMKKYGTVDNMPQFAQERVEKNANEAKAFYDANKDLDRKKWSLAGVTTMKKENAKKERLRRRNEMAELRAACKGDPQAFAKALEAKKEQLRMKKELARLERMEAPSRTSMSSPEDASATERKKSNDMSLKRRESPECPDDLPTSLEKKPRAH